MTDFEKTYQNYNPRQAALDEARALLTEAAKAAMADGTLPEAELPAFIVEIPADVKNGDIASNLAMAGARTWRKAPKMIADALIAHLPSIEGSVFSKVEVAGPGFINLFLSQSFWAGVVLGACANKEYGRTDHGKGAKYNVEFVSANPTGPMHMGNARGGVLGDTLAEVLDWSGADVWREFYVNDFGNQIEKFAKSIEARYIQLIKGEDAIEFPEDGYHGDDIRELAKAFYDIHGDSYLEKSVEERHADMARFGLDRNIPKMKSDLERYGIKFDEWFFESSLHNSGYVKDTVEELHKLGWTYEKEGALWLKTADIMREQYRKQGKKDEDIDKLDLKDDVLRRANGFYTYFAGDIAYHRNKFAVRHFDKVINIWGADHHGHVARMKGAMDALGLDGTNRLDIVLMQLVKLVRDGEVVRMSKRTGKTISLSDLLDEIPVDACRYFFNAKPDTQMEFDLGLAVREDSENPIYYIQYAHARICSLLKALEEEGHSVKSGAVDLSILRAMLSTRSSRNSPPLPRKFAWQRATTTRATSTAISCALPRRSTSSTTPAASRARTRPSSTRASSSRARPVRCSPTASRSSAAPHRKRCKTVYRQQKGVRPLAGRLFRLEKPRRVFTRKEYAASVEQQSC